MERTNNLSSNLKAYQMLQGRSLAEFSAELGIPRSTVQSAMVEGNTNLDTLIRMANALHITIDELVFGSVPAKADKLLRFLRHLHWFAKLSLEKQTKFRYHLGELLKLLECDG